MKAQHDTFADFCPYFVGSGVNNHVPRTDIVGDFFIETRLEPANAVVGVLLVFNFT